MVETISICSSRKKEVIDLTAQIQFLVKKHKIIDGMITVSALHTTCCITTGEIGEGTDDDLLETVERMIPKIQFRHAHDPTHAWSHMASSIVGCSKSFIVKNGKLTLGTWQSICCVELDGPRERNLAIALIRVTS